ncbi:MAG: UDP-3-O-(3-hydroxymyristoyl)glucosamine N-acyltransferase [Vicinamibacterales bacterium]
MVAVTLSTLAEATGCALEGDPSAVVSRVAALDAAAPGDLTFLTNAKYGAALQRTRASAAIVGLDVASAPCALLRSSTPYVALARALDLLNPRTRPEPGIHPTAVIGRDVELGDGVHIGPLVTVGAGSRIGKRTVVVGQVHIGSGARIGADCLLHAHVSVREDVTLGDRVILQDGVVIGADGYGFATRSDGSHVKIPQVGRVVIEDDVEIGANTTVDRPAIGETRIAAGTKIDNLVQIAHGVRIGRHVLLAAQVGIAGSTTVEDHVVLAGQVGVAGHLTIGRGARATAQTGIPNSIEPGTLVSGYPAIDNRDWLKSSAVFRRLPELKRAFAALEHRVAELEAALATTRDDN